MLYADVHMIYEKNEHELTKDSTIPGKKDERVVLNCSILQSLCKYMVLHPKCNKSFEHLLHTKFIMVSQGDTTSITAEKVMLGSPECLTPFH